MIQVSSYDPFRLIHVAMSNDSVDDRNSERNIRNKHVNLNIVPNISSDDRFQTK